MAGPAPTTLSDYEDRSAGPVHSRGWLWCRRTADGEASFFREGSPTHAQPAAPQPVRSDGEACRAKAQPKQDAGRTAFDRGFGCVADECEDRQPADQSADNAQRTFKPSGIAN